MTAIPRPRTPWALLAPALLLGLLGPAGGLGPTYAAAAAARLAATAPLTDGQATLQDRAIGPRAVDGRDQRDRPGGAPPAVVRVAAGAPPSPAGAVLLAAGGRGGPGREGAAGPRGPPRLQAS